MSKSQSSLTNQQKTIQLMKAALHIKIELDFIPLDESPMPRGREFLVLFNDHGTIDFGRAWIEETLDPQPEDTVWHPSFDWNYDECEQLTVTHWAELSRYQGYKRRKE